MVLPAFLAETSAEVALEARLWQAVLTLLRKSCCSLLWLSVVQLKDSRLPPQSKSSAQQKAGAKQQTLGSPLVSQFGRRFAEIQCPPACLLLPPDASVAAGWR